MGKARRGAVREAFLLAQLHVQPGLERAAQNRVQHQNREVIWRIARYADMTDPNLGLRRRRAIDEVDPDRCRRFRQGTSS